MKKKKNNEQLVSVDIPEITKDKEGLLVGGFTGLEVQPTIRSNSNDQPENNLAINNPCNQNDRCGINLLCI